MNCLVPEEGLALAGRVHWPVGDPLLRPEVREVLHELRDLDVVAEVQLADIGVNGDRHDFFFSFTYA